MQVLQLLAAATLKAQAKFLAYSSCRTCICLIRSPLCFAVTLSRRRTRLSVWLRLTVKRQRAPLFDPKTVYITCWKSIPTEGFVWPALADLCFCMLRYHVLLPCLDRSQYYGTACPAAPDLPFVNAFTSTVWLLMYGCLWILDVMLTGAKLDRHLLVLCHTHPKHDELIVSRLGSRIEEPSL